MGFCGFISRTACFLLQAERQEMESDPQRLHYCSAGLSRTRAHTRVRGIRSRKQVKRGLSVTPFPRGHLIKLIFTDRSCYLQQEVGFICRTVETGLLGNAMDPLETSSLLKRSINITSCHTSENVRLSANEPADIGLEHSSIPC